MQIGVGRSTWSGKPPPPISERALDGIPGCIAWFTLLFCVVSAIAFPKLLLIIATLVAIYSSGRFVLVAYANFIGNQRIKQTEMVDWYSQYLQDTGDTPSVEWESVHHIVLIPNFEEPEELIIKSLENLATMPLAKTQMTIVLAMEAAEEGCVNKAEVLQQKYTNQFANIYFTVHPRGLPGEMQCKSANQAWAVRWIKRKLVDEKDYDMDHLIVTTMDTDTIWHQAHFSALTYHFLVDQDRYHTYWQAPIRYHSNIWRLNPLLQLVNIYSSAFELAYLSAPWWRSMPISSYSLSMRLLDVSGYWDADVIADEWHMYIKSFFANYAHQKLVPIFLPFTSYATNGKNLWQASVNRYSQTLRHAWGSKEVGYIVTKILENPAITYRPSIMLLLRVAHDILLSGAGWILVTLGSLLPIVFHQDLRIEFFEKSFQNPIFIVLQIALMVMFVVGIVVWAQDIRIRPLRDRPITPIYIVLTLLSFPLLPLLTLVFVALPVLHAQTQLLIGASLKFRVSKKL